MKRLVIDPLGDASDALREAAAAIAAGGVVGYPTDTLYGLAVDPRRNAAVQRLFEVKGRDPSAAIPLIAGDEAAAGEAGVFGDDERRLARALWPGPLTIVVPASPALSPLVTGGAGTVGVRVPAHPVARGLAAAFGGCITATSANPSGRPAAVTADAVAAALGDRIDLLLDAGPAPGGPPSTIVRVEHGRATLLRPGALPWERVLESLE